MILNHSFKISNFPCFQENLIRLSEKHDVSCILNSNNYQTDTYSKFPLIAAFGVSEEYCFYDDAFGQLNHLLQSNPGWIFGHFSYNLKNQIENLTSKNPDLVGFSPCYFFKPKILIKINNDCCEVWCNENESIDNRELEDFLQSTPQVIKLNPFRLKERTSRDTYIDTISKIKKYIKRGDIYEMNYCVEYYADNIETDPYTLYNQLNNISPNPFSAFYKNKNRYLICASPERFVCKRNEQIISQPIKGTSARFLNQDEDQESYNNLLNSKKENAENIMITDLVRNDLSKIAEKKSVEVEELCKIYAFPQVFQMISTIKALKRKDITNAEVIKALFPMGSMTGAPKISACKIIDQLENINRGLYSGSVGYFSPDGDFDFNVVIRSLQYNRDSRYLSYMAGSAITWASEAEKEYDECRLKAASLDKIFKK